MGLILQGSRGKKRSGRIERMFLKEEDQEKLQSELTGKKGHLS